MVNRGTLHIPTLAVQSDYSRFADDPSLLDSPLLATMIGAKAISVYKQPPGMLAGWLRLSAQSERQTRRPYERSPLRE